MLKATFEATGVGQGSMEVQSFELNPGLADDLFTFQVPEGARVVEMQAQEPVPLSLEEARAAAEFPLLVPECLLIEPTESEAKEALDGFMDALEQIREEAESNPDVVTTAPHTLPVKRLDEVRAARQLDLAWKPE